MHRESERDREVNADYRAGVLWAAFVNSQGGAGEEGAKRAVKPQEMFPSLVPILGSADSEDDTEALIDALKSRGAKDLRQK